MNKCVIVHCPKLFYKGEDICSTINYSAMGLFSLASALEKENFDVKIINLAIEKYLNKDFLLSDYIKQKGIKLVAISLNWHQQTYDVIETAQIIKIKCPDIHISLGGLTASFFAKEIMEKYPFINSVIKGEGEKSIGELAKRVYAGQTCENIPNLLWRKGKDVIINSERYVASGEDLDNIEFFKPESMLHYQEYLKIPYILNFSKENQLNCKSEVHGVCLGRGCYGNCVWCGGAYITNKLSSGRSNISYRNIDNVIKEIKLMKEQYNIDSFSFSFDPNPNDRSHLVKLFNRLADEFNGSLNVIYNLDGLPDKEFLDAFKWAFSDTSVIMLSPVFANEELRKEYKSFYYSNKQLEEILEYMEQNKIKSELYFSNMPGVKDKEIAESEKYGEFLKNKYKCIQACNMYDVDIEPGAPWTYSPEKYNLKKVINTISEYYDRNKAVESSFEYC